MNYYITIQDIDNLEDELILHFAERSSIVLKWQGGDDKTKNIIPSQLKFSLLVRNGEEGKYDKYFTTNEQKWLVRLYEGDPDDIIPDELIWKGYLLPETYTEPWDNSSFFVYFSAIDGFGLLKGKYFDPELYTKEVTVTDIICAALKECGLGFDTWISPAIINTNKPNWKDVILDLTKYDGEENPSIYDVLEDIIYSMRCRLYQADGRFNVEGFNKVNLPKVTWRIFDENGAESNFTISSEKNIKQLTWLAYPDITLISPFKRTIATQDSPAFELDENVVELQEPPFEPNLHSEADKYYYSTYWNENGGYFPEVLSEDNNLILANYSLSLEFDQNRFISLRSKPYLIKGQRYKITIETELDWVGDKPNNPSDALIESWLNYSVYSLLINDKEIYTNYRKGEFAIESLAFDSGGKADTEITFTVKESGYLDFKFFEPFGIPDDQLVGAYRVRTLEIENINDDGETVYTVEIDENASKEGEIDLPISDDPTGNTLNWQLDYVRKLAAGGTLFDFEIYYWFDIDGKRYFVVPLRAGIYAKEYDVQILGDGNTYTLNNKEVIFNYEGGEETVITGDFTIHPSDAERIQINVKGLREPVIPRDQWMEWSDDFYKIERKRYGQVVAEVESRLFKIESVQLEGNAKNPIKINDIIRFRYKNEWMYLSVNNCEWNIGNNESSLLLSECVYGGNGINKLEPFVYAGADKTIANLGGVVFAGDSAAVSPFGTIETYSWTQIEGTAQIDNADQLHALFYGFTTNHNVFRLTVTDSFGNTAFDDFNVDVSFNSVISFDLLDSFEGRATQSTTEDEEILLWEKIKINLNPDLPDDYSVNLFFESYLFAVLDSPASTYSYVLIIKNGVQTNYVLSNSNMSPDGVEEEREDSWSNILSMKKGDDVTVIVYAKLTYKGIEPFVTKILQSTFSINKYEVATGFPKITGLPIKSNVQYDYGDSLNAYPRPLPEPTIP